MFTIIVLLVAGTQTRYQVKEFADGGAFLRIDPVKANRDDTTYECVAENGVGDAVSAVATLAVFEGKFASSSLILQILCIS